MKKIFYTLLVILAGCSYSVYSGGYPHLDTIKINVFENTTVQYQLEDKVVEILASKFQSNGRLKIVTQNADCLIEGELIDYSNKIRDYGTQNIEEYEVRILFKIIFTDLKKNEIIWQNNALEIKESYSSSDPTSKFKTESAAQDEIINKLFKKIVNKSLEEW